MGRGVEESTRRGVVQGRPGGIGRAPAPRLGTLRGPLWFRPRASAPGSAAQPPAVPQRPAFDDSPGHGSTEGGAGPMLRWTPRSSPPGSWTWRIVRRGRWAPLPRARGRGRSQPPTWHSSAPPLPRARGTGPPAKAAPRRIAPCTGRVPTRNWCRGLPAANHIPRDPSPRGPCPRRQRSPSGRSRPTRSSRRSWWRSWPSSMIRHGGSRRHQSGWSSPQLGQRSGGG